MRAAPEGVNSPSHFTISLRKHIEQDSAVPEKALRKKLGRQKMFWRPMLSENCPLKLWLKLEGDLWDRIQSSKLLFYK